MASGRMLKKEISNSEKLGAVKTDRARVLYLMMLPHLDATGRLEANVRQIKGQIVTMLPYSEKSIQTSLEQLHEASLIILYTNSGKQYLEYARFKDFQTINPNREAESTIPPPTPEDSRGLQNTPQKLSLNEVNLSEDKYISIFEQARKIYLGTKRGLEEEYANFEYHCKHPLRGLPVVKPVDIVALLEPAIERQIEQRSKSKEFIPSWKNFSTWINQRCWTQESPESKPKQSPRACCVCGSPNIAMSTADGDFCSGDCYKKKLKTG